MIDKAPVRRKRARRRGRRPDLGRARRIGIGPCRRASRRNFFPSSTFMTSTISRSPRRRRRCRVVATIISLRAVAAEFVDIDRPVRQHLPAVRSVGQRFKVGKVTATLADLADARPNVVYVLTPPASHPRWRSRGWTWRHVLWKADGRHRRRLRTDACEITRNRLKLASITPTCSTRC